MSAHISVIDNTARCVWISYYGNGSWIEVDLISYCIEYQLSESSPYTDGVSGRIGISFPGGEYDSKAISQFAVAAAIVIDGLTRSGSRRSMDQNKFAASLSIVQSYQTRSAQRKTS
jgi:hypothetical protein